MNYIELQITLKPEFAEIMIAELAEIGYESFIETESGLNAYIRENSFEEEGLKNILQNYHHQFLLEFSYRQIEQQNWNQIWEESYQPVIIADLCIIKSHFHQIDTQYPYEIWIHPRMAFGTGHHETTALMIENQLEISHQDKTVLDAGCGTGILAIMAAKLGAKFIDASDIDEWAINNSLENIAINDCANINVIQGDIHHPLLREKYDIILANINKNVLIEEIPFYKKHLSAKGILLLSGFYTEDAAAICQKAADNLLIKKTEKVKNNWLSLIFENMDEYKI